MVEVAVIDGFVNTVKLLIFEIPNAWHKVESEQMTECEDDFGIAMCIGGVLPDFQNRVVLQQAVQNIQRFTRATGNNLGAEH